MLPSLFKTQEEIIRKLRGIAQVHSFENAQTISHIFYDVFKISYYALKRKKEGINNTRGIPITLKRTEITRLMKLIDYHHSNDKAVPATHELTQCFGAAFSETDALTFFQHYVEGDTKDKSGRMIHIDLEDGVKFMYKNPATGRHEMESKYYLPHRGKRLPWIRHTLHNTTNIYTRTIEDNREILYLSKYDLPGYDNESNKCYWAVIVKKYRKDQIAPYNFKTAFPIFQYNHLISRLERYQPIWEVPYV